MKKALPRKRAEPRCVLRETIGTVTTGVELVAALPKRMDSTHRSRGLAVRAGTERSPRLLMPWHRSAFVFLLLKYNILYF